MSEMPERRRKSCATKTTNEGAREASDAAAEIGFFRLA